MTKIEIANIIKEHFSILTLPDGNSAEEELDKLVTALHRKFAEKEESVCDTAPFPECNGANGCDTCEHQPNDNE